MGNLPSYDELNANFDWAIAERELGYRPGDVINIGWMCSDRLCRMGLAQKPALLWEDYQGNQKRFTYNDLRVYSNTIAHFLADLGILPESEYACFSTGCPSCTSDSWAF